MEFLSVTEIWKYLKWLPGFILRRLFTKKRLADLVIIDIRPRHQSVTVNLGDVASFNIYFQVINMTPFEIELDRAEIEFNCAGIRLKSQHIKKTTYRPGEIATLYVEGDIDSAKANEIARHHDKNKSSINLHCEFNCQLHNFQKPQHNLEGVNTEFINTKWRNEQIENA